MALKRSRGQAAWPNGVSREQAERVCRMYHTRADAARALGIASKNLQRILDRYGIKPHWRKP